jgi:hypothetical protein
MEHNGAGSNSEEYLLLDVPKTKQHSKLLTPDIHKVATGANYLDSCLFLKQILYFVTQFVK